MRTLYTFVFLALWATTRAQPLHEPIQKTAESKNGMVVSAHPIASRIGVEILKKGGNAIDAAVAVQFALAVVYPRAGNLGGGGFLLYRTQTGEVFSLDFREKAPLAAHRDMYLNPQGKAVDSLSRDGALAVGVPGNVAGTLEAHRRWGRLPLADLLAGAIMAADSGFRLTPGEAELYNKYSPDFLRFSSKRPALVHRGFPQTGWRAGDTLTQPELANTLRAIQAQGAAGFYGGWVADSLVAEMQHGKGLITHADLQGYNAQAREPIAFAYKDFLIYSMGPPSSGGVLLAQMLQMLETQPLRRWGMHSPNAIHAIVEAQRRAYADRSKHLGDRDFYPVPLRKLLDTSYIRARFRDLNLAKATPIAAIQPADFGKESEETTHFSIVDAEGNAVSLTTTLNHDFGARVFVAGAGFCLNNEMDDFSAAPGSPNFYGLLGSEANAIAPGKRMLSSMTPTIVTQNGQLRLVVGTPGGSTIPNSVLQVILNVIEFGCSPAEAVNAPRFHHQWSPDKLFYDQRFAQRKYRKLWAELRRRGHNPTERKSFGQVELIVVQPDGIRKGAGDGRGNDTAIGY